MSDTRRPTRHGPVAQLLIALSPLSLVPLLYLLGGWLDLGLGPHETAAATVDRHLFGVVPSVWLQQHLVDGSAHWYDAASSLVYGTHFVAIPVVTALVWFRHRDRYRAWLAAVLTFTAVGVTGYVLFPAAPPWLVSDAGLIGPVDRISDRGWSYLHLTELGRVFGAGQAESNPIAAVPSLHAGSALLVALFLWPVVGPRWRAVLLAYPLLMAVALVYTGEHFVLDVLAGWLTAGAAVGVGRALRNRGPRMRPRQRDTERHGTPADTDLVPHPRRAGPAPR